MTIRKILTHVGVLFIVFILGIFAFSHLMNIENTDRTQAVEGPTLPVVFVRASDDRIVNEMYGYTADMAVSYMRDTVCVLPSDYELKLAVAPYGNELKEVSYEVRSSSDGSLIENNTVNYITQRGDYLEAALPIQRLLEEKQEYLLTVTLHMTDGRNANYYTRIVDRAGSDVLEELDFCRYITDLTFNEDDARELVNYMEPNSASDNSTYAHVDIHSNYRLLVWRGLNAVRETDPVFSITEIRSNSVSVRESYLLSTADDEGTKEYYTVEENFRVRIKDDRKYLLDYERTMNQIFLPQEAAFGKKSINFGILSEENEVRTSNDGKVAAFVQNGTLWMYNSRSGAMARVYGNADDLTDSRKRHTDYRVRLARVDESGGVDFIVYGYINQGKHEGNVGILACHFDAVLGNVEETVFIPYDKCFAHMDMQVGRLGYINRNRQFYCILDGSVYKVDLNARTFEVLATSLPEDGYVISEDGSDCAWITSDSISTATSLELWNMEEDTKSVIDVASQERVRPIGFLGHDLVCGIADADMMRLDRTGKLIFPMKELIIVDEKGDVLNSYEGGGTFVTETRMNENRVELTRVYMDGETGSLLAAPADQIISNESEIVGGTRQEKYTTDRKKTQYRLRFEAEIPKPTDELRIPKDILFEESRNLELPLSEKEDVNFYVYGRGHLDGAYTRAGDAIDRAEELQGVVVTAQGAYIWEKGNRVTKTPTSSITARAAMEGEPSVAVCVELMLADAGVYESVNDLMQQGMSALEILNRDLPHRVVDLTGCSLDAALYFSSRGVPVLAMKDAATAVLILGYDEFGNTILMDAVAGSIYKCGPNDSRAMFEAAGNVFITYVP